MSDQPDREGEVFSAARKLPAGQRTAYLSNACGNDAVLLQRVEELLKANEQAGVFLENPAPGVESFPLVESPLGPGGTVRITPALSEKSGDKIGRYKLLQQIGEGGCGVVYMAEQSEPVRRQVALKVIKLGMDTKNVIARFEAERQALALMDHPNIAKVLDAGATDVGRPYFVMELVRGIKITDYCDQNNLSTRERLDLFIQVCRAIQHAHQKGIIHRDIKPSNILVTLRDGMPVPKVIDFGIAKATTDQRLTDKTLFTAFEQFIGTPAYMSPEQAEMSELGIDTRSDIYSLGVLLYELLTGQTPFDAQVLLRSGLDEIRRIIREEEPACPSTRLSTLTDLDLTEVAKHRQMEPAKLSGLVRGELDWIVMKALEKDRARRYETANGLAMDVERHLNNEPVLAGPPGTTYRIRKFVRRHRAGVMAGSLVLLALLAGIVGTTWGLVDALHQKREAERQGKIAGQTTQFLTGMFQSIDPAEAKLHDITVRQVLDVAAQTISTNFPDQPMTELPIRRTMAVIYEELGRDDLALVQAEAGLHLVQSTQGNKDSTEKADSMDSVAIYLSGLGRSAEALPMHEAALAMNEKIYKGDNKNTAASLCDVASCLDDLGRPAEALPKFKEALAMDERIYKGDHHDVAHILNYMAHCLDDLGRSAEALPIHEAALEMQQRIYRGDHSEVADNLNNIAYSLVSLGRSDEALPKFEAALAMKERIYKGDHIYVALSLNNIAVCLDNLGRSSEALTNNQAALEMYRRIYKSDHPDVARSYYNFARSLYFVGNLPEALTNYEAALTMIQRINRQDDWRTALIINSIANCQDIMGNLDDAVQTCQKGVVMLQRLSVGEPSNKAAKIRLVNAQRQMGNLLRRTGQSNSATEAYQQGISLAESILLDDKANKEAAKIRLSLRAKLGLEKVNVVIRKITPNSQAEQIGLHPGDILISCAGQPVETASDVDSLTHRIKDGQNKLKILRDGMTREFTITEGSIGVTTEDLSLSKQNEPSAPK